MDRVTRIRDYRLREYGFGTSGAHVISLGSCCHCTLYSLMVHGDCTQNILSIYHGKIYCQYVMPPQLCNLFAIIVDETKLFVNLSLKRGLLNTATK